MDSDRSGKYTTVITRARVLYQQLKAGLCQPHGRRIHANRVFHYIFAIFFKNGWKKMLFKSLEVFRDYTTEKSKHLLLLPFLSKVTAYRVKSHLNRVLSYLSLSIKTSVVLYIWLKLKQNSLNNLTTLLCFTILYNKRVHSLHSQIIFVLKEVNEKKKYCKVYISNASFVGYRLRKKHCILITKTKIVNSLIMG